MVEVWEWIWTQHIVFIRRILIHCDTVGVNGTRGGHEYIQSKPNLNFVAIKGSD